MQVLENVQIDRKRPSKPMINSNGEAETDRHTRIIIIMIIITINIY